MDGLVISLQPSVALHIVVLVLKLYKTWEWLTLCFSLSLMLGGFIFDRDIWSLMKGLRFRFSNTLSSDIRVWIIWWSSWRYEKFGSNCGFPEVLSWCWISNTLHSYQTVFPSPWLGEPWNKEATVVSSRAKLYPLSCLVNYLIPSQWIHICITCGQTYDRVVGDRSCRFGCWVIRSNQVKRVRPGLTRWNQVRPGRTRGDLMITSCNQIKSSLVVICIKVSYTHSIQNMSS